jgi:hypothetical protein
MSLENDNYLLFTTTNHGTKDFIGFTVFYKKGMKKI